MCDPVTRFFVKHATIMLIIAIGFVSTTLPLNFANFALVIFMTIIVVNSLRSETQKEFYQSSSSIFWMLSVITLLALGTRYAAQFIIIFKL